MLLEVRYDPTMPPVCDGQIFTFGYHGRNHGFLVGEANTPPRHTRPGLLAAIAVLLRNYVKTPNDDLGRQITATVAQLEGGLTTP
jgi:hypothetical protein